MFPRNSTICCDLLLSHNINRVGLDQDVNTNLPKNTKYCRVWHFPLPVISESVMMLETTMLLECVVFWVSHKNWILITCSHQSSQLKCPSQISTQIIIFSLSKFFLKFQLGTMFFTYYLKLLCSVAVCC